MYNRNGHYQKFGKKVGKVIKNIANPKNPQTPAPNPPLPLPLPQVIQPQLIVNPPQENINQVQPIVETQQPEAINTSDEGVVNNNNAVNNNEQVQEREIQTQAAPEVVVAEDKQDEINNDWVDIEPGALSEQANNNFAGMTPQIIQQYFVVGNQPGRGVEPEQEEGQDNNVQRVNQI